MKIAAVDIGSNAARLQISSILNHDDVISFKKVEYVRFPLRLGIDVFNTGKISSEREAQIKKLLTVYKGLMELHEVADYRICATSAMREASNGKDVVRRVKEELGMEIVLIDGEKEAELINDVVVKILDKRKRHLHIDVGGGSTELNLYINREKKATKSFKIGSVRLLENKVSPEVWQKMQEWIADNIDPDKGDLIAVGTGGNISKLSNMIVNKIDGFTGINQLKEMRNYLADFSYEDRVNKLQLNPDRADVIVPASDIYISVMEWAGASKMIVPDLGLKDGVILMVYEELMGEEV